MNTSSNYKVKYGKPSPNFYLDKTISEVKTLYRLDRYIKLPFSYILSIQMEMNKVLKQRDPSKPNNTLSHFFHTIEYLLNDGYIRIGKELKVETNHNGNVIVKLSGNKTEAFQLPNVDTKVLYIDFTSIYPLYLNTVSEALTHASLLSCFKSCDAYIGLSKRTQFKWFENDILKQQLNDNNECKSKRTSQTITNNTSAYMFDYDILSKLMNVDFEHAIESINYNN